MTTYRVTGKPLAPPAPVLEGREIGDTFDADLDQETEQHLVAVGALATVSEPAKQEEPSERQADTAVRQPRSGRIGR